MLDSSAIEQGERVLPSIPGAVSHDEGAILKVKEEAQQEGEGAKQTPDHQWHESGITNTNSPWSTSGAWPLPVSCP